MNKLTLTTSLMVTLLVGIGIGYLLSPTPEPNAANGKAISQPSQAEPLFWRNPMNPAITSPIFTQDEMGMDYLPVYAEEMARKHPVGTVIIDPVTVQNIGVRSAIAERRQLSRNLNSLGRIDFNEERLARLHPKTSGWIEELRIEETGTAVSKDTILLSIYSPELVAAQQEYLVALKNWDSAKNSLAPQMKNRAQTIRESARERLQLFDVPQHQIHELEQSRKIKKQLHIHSPFEGRIMNIGAREGQFVSPNDELYLIADLSRIWVNVDIFEDELRWIKLGDKAKITVRAESGRSYQGHVTFIHPTLNTRSRTAQVRLEFDNPEMSLKPGMFANVTLYTDPQADAVVVPSEAIVRSGSREQLFVIREPGKFEPREVTLGISADGFTQILAGLNAGEEVVTSSQFLIDSESKLREATAKMMAVMDNSMDHHEHADMSMEGMDMSEMSMADFEMGNNDQAIAPTHLHGPETPEMQMNMGAEHDH